MLQQKIDDLLCAENELNELHDYLDQIGCPFDVGDRGEWLGNGNTTKPSWQTRGHASSRIAAYLEKQKKDKYNSIYYKPKKPIRWDCEIE